MSLPFRTFGVLLLTVFIDLLAFGMVIPILPLYALELHATPQQVGLLVAVYSLAQLMFSPILGRLSDRYGRRPVLLISIMGSMLSQIGYSYAGTVEQLLIARAVAGVCGANISAAQAYIADVTDEKSRAPAMGMLGAAFGLGFVIGPTLGGLLGKDRTLPFMFAAGLSALNLIWAAFALVEPRSKAERTAARALTWKGLVHTISQPGLRVLILLFFLITLGFANFETTFSIYLKERFRYGRAQASYLFAYIGINMVIAQGVLVRRLVTRVGEQRLMVAGLAMMAAGFGVMSMATGLPELLASISLISIGMGLNNPSLSSLISRAAGKQQGGVLGVSQSFGSLARVIGPLAGGFLLDVRLSAPLVAAAGMMVLGTIITSLAVAPERDPA